MHSGMMTATEMEQALETSFTARVGVFITAFNWACTRPQSSQAYTCGRALASTKRCGPTLSIKTGEPRPTRNS